MKRIQEGYDGDIVVSIERWVWSQEFHPRKGHTMFRYVEGPSVKVLFVCKKRVNHYGISTGLFNSASFVSNALNERLCLESKVVSVIDNNYIDREVHAYKPHCVIIEAFWVVPSKFHVLCALYPNVQWFVRSHSKIPFFANEGIAMNWMWGYSQIAKWHKNFHIAANDLETSLHLSKTFRTEVFYLPNIYCPPAYGKTDLGARNPNEIHIGCFGAIRPMKNTLIQAVAAVRFATKIDKKLYFHINGTRTEQAGDNALKNLRYLFEGLDHELVEHPWMSHEDFIEVVRSMDMGMQVSLSESFNIVTADFVWHRKPVVVSPDIEWVSDSNKANPNKVKSIVRALKRVRLLSHVGLNWLNLLLLQRHNRKATHQWLDVLWDEVLMA